MKLIPTGNNLLLIKIGGSILHDEKKIDSLCKDIKTIKDSGFDVVLVHGGSKAIYEALAIHGIPSEFVDGLRVTSAAAIKIIETVLCGQVNLAIVKNLNRLGTNAIGLSGAYQQLLLCDYHSEIHGFVGEIKSIHTALIHHILSFQNNGSNSIPVISTIGVDKEGKALNINADMAAYHIACALGVHQLIYLTDQDGIYNSHGQIVSQLSNHNLQTLIDESIVSGGMLIKAKAVLAALNAGLNHVSILNGNQKNVLLDVILHKKMAGTLCKTDSLEHTLLGEEHESFY